MTQIEELSELFHRIPVPIYRTAPDGKLLAGNSALAELLGYDTVEEAKKAVVDAAFVDPSQREQWLTTIDESGVVYDFDVQLRRPDGTSVWLQDTARAVKDENGNLKYYEGALLDVTEKVRAKQAKDEFLATVSHEMRNPITAVLGLGEELATNYDSFSDDNRREIAQLIARQAEDASWLIEDLLIAYREDVSTVPILSQDFDVIKACERVLEVVDQPIEVEVVGSDRRVHADPRRARQILRNLVSNAQRHGGDHIAMQVEAVGDRVEVRVCDNGPAIDGADVEKIFKPFETLGENRHSASVGLGLPVARRLARLMDGDLTYRHSSDMSCFVLSLPVA